MNYQDLGHFIRLGVDKLRYPGNPHPIIVFIIIIISSLPNPEFLLLLLSIIFLLLGLAMLERLAKLISEVTRDINTLLMNKNTLSVTGDRKWTINW